MSNIKHKTMPTNFRIIAFFFSLITFLACNKDSVIEAEVPVEQKSEYIFLGHTYFKSNRIDPRLETINYSAYKGVWLGGDLCSETTRERATIDYLDAIFDLGNEETHWAVGNHDVRNGNLDWITTATGRELFHANTKDGITVATFDTNVGHVNGRNATCEDRMEQADFLLNLIDTIQSSSHLILLTHWVVWGEVEPNIPCAILANNCINGFQFLCGGGASRFPPFLYDKLAALEARGIEVMVISGDGGVYTKQFHHQTQEGVDFFISGLFSTLDRDNPPTFAVGPPVNLNPDSILIFKHAVAERKLDWQFINLDDLVDEGKF